MELVPLNIAHGTRQPEAIMIWRAAALAEKSAHATKLCCHRTN
jgi:hypothetical protein